MICVEDPVSHPAHEPTAAHERRQNSANLNRKTLRPKPKAPYTTSYTQCSEP